MIRRYNRPNATTPKLSVQHESEPARGRKKTDSSYAMAVGVKL